MTFQRIARIGLVVLLSGSCCLAYAMKGPPAAVDLAPSDQLARGLFTAEQGAWRTRTELLIDPATHALTRRTVTIWDPMPSRRLQFIWTPAEDTESPNGVVSGDGTLEWRLPDKPDFDPKALIARFVGHMKDGRPDGDGEYRDAAGTYYAGHWANGVAEGAGRIQYPDGGEYEGAFHAGLPEGDGRYTDAAGETFRGSFVTGRRDGVGIVTLANGQSYRSEWVRGVETGPSARARFAAAGPAGGVSPDVLIGVSVAPVFDAYVFADEEGSQKLSPDLRQEVRQNVEWFAGTNQPDGLSVKPGNKRMLDMWKGTVSIALTDSEESSFYHTSFSDSSAYGVFSLTPVFYPALDLAVNVQNKSAKAVQISGIYLDVASSTTDLQPAIQITTLPDGLREDCGPDAKTGGINPVLRLENFGWGPARNVELRYAIGSGPQRTVRLPDISKATTADLADDLHQGGVKSAASIKAAMSAAGRLVTGMIVDWEEDERMRDQNRRVLSSIQRSGVYGSLSDQLTFTGALVQIAVRGQLSYDWTDNAGQVHHRISPFVTKLTIGQMPNFGECGEGGAIDRVNKKPLLFRADASHYRLAYPLQRGVPPGRSANYVLAVDAKRASEHKFSLVVQLADGRELRSRPIDLLMFRPRK